MTNSAALDTVYEIVADPSFAITTSLLWDPTKPPTAQTLPLRFHQTRLLASAHTFNLTHLTTILRGDSGLSLLSNYLNSHNTNLSQSPHKVTLSLFAEGTITSTTSAANPPLYPFHLPSAHPPSSPTLTATIYLALHPTESSPFTTHKTTHRSQYTDARAFCSLSPNTPPTSTEVLLYNDRNEVTEASLSTVFFWRDGGWVTPAADCGGNQGASRALALERAWCAEMVVKKEDVQMGEVVCLSNAVRGFWFAVVSELEGRVRSS